VKLKNIKRAREIDDDGGEVQLKGRVNQLLIKRNRLQMENGNLKESHKCLSTHIMNLHDGAIEGNEAMSDEELAAIISGVKNQLRTSEEVLVEYSQKMMQLEVEKSVRTSFELGSLDSRTGRISSSNSKLPERA